MGLPQPWGAVPAQPQQVTLQRVMVRSLQTAVPPQPPTGVPPQPPTGAPPQPPTGASPRPPTGAPLQPRTGEPHQPRKRALCPPARAVPPPSRPRPSRTAQPPGARRARPRPPVQGERPRAPPWSPGGRMPAEWQAPGGRGGQEGGSVDEGLLTVHRVAGMMPSHPSPPLPLTVGRVWGLRESRLVSRVCACEWWASQRQDRPQPLHGFPWLLSFASFPFCSRGTLLWGYSGGPCASPVCLTTPQAGPAAPSPPRP